MNHISSVDNVLARQKLLLSFQDRNDINEEIHGVQSMACEETPELIEDSLRLLFIELQNLSSHFQTIYQQACVDVMAEDQFDDNLFSGHEIPSVASNISPCYVKSRNFQLAFLRCEFFDAKKAALRFSKYLELVYDLFGEEALRRPLRVDDFRSKEEIEVLDAGFQQLLPFRDRCGRRVLFIHGDMNLPSSSLMDRSILSKGPAMKVLLYLWSVLIEDERSQRRGLVIVFWPRYIDHSIPQISEQATEPTFARTSGSKKKGNPKRNSRKPRKFNRGTEDDKRRLSTLVPDANARSTGIRFFDAVPVRICAIHVCLHDAPFLRLVRNMTLFLLGENLRNRMKSHDGKKTKPMDH